MARTQNIEKTTEQLRDFKAGIIKELNPDLFSHGDGGRFCVFSVGDYEVTIDLDAMNTKELPYFYNGVAMTKKEYEERKYFEEQDHDFSKNDEVN